MHMAAVLPSDIGKVDPAQAWQPWPDDQQPWSAKWAAHLFRRAGFGASPAEIEQAVKEGFAATPDKLLVGSPETAKRDELLADLGDEFARDGEDYKLRGWWLYAMLNSGHPLREKLVLGWHNHFATSIVKVGSLPAMFRQNQLIRKHALGKFGPFLKEMSRDPAMLIWLDSNENVKAHPNENYAREVMELFSLGVGNYTERDVQEAARAFTGWHTDSNSEKFAFNAAEHDDGAKTVLKQTGKWDGDDVLRILLEQDCCARFLAGKLYRDLVSEIPPPKELLEPLAERFRKSEYDIADLVKTILSSRLFFSEHAYQKRIKNPVEFVLGAVKAAWPGPVAPGDVVSNLDAMGQALFAPPNVKGWPGGKVWLNDSTLLARNNFAEWAAIGIAGRSQALPPSVPAPLATASVPQPAKLPTGPAPEQPEPPEKFDISLHARKNKAASPKEIVARLAEQFVPGGLNANATRKLETFLADGNPKDKELNRRIREAAHAMMCMPEYQLC
jgi:hypothetical protein